MSFSFFFSLLLWTSTLRKQYSPHLLSKHPQLHLDTHTSIHKQTVAFHAASHVLETHTQAAVLCTQINTHAHAHTELILHVLWLLQPYNGCLVALLPSLSLLLPSLAVHYQPWSSSNKTHNSIAATDCYRISKTSLPMWPSWNWRTFPALQRCSCLIPPRLFSPATPFPVTPQPPVSAPFSLLKLLLWTFLWTLLCLLLFFDSRLISLSPLWFKGRWTCIQMLFGPNYPQLRQLQYKYSSIHPLSYPCCILWRVPTLNWSQWLQPTFKIISYMLRDDDLETFRE